MATWGLLSCLGCVSATEAEAPPEGRYQLFVYVTPRGTSEAWLVEAGDRSVSTYEEGASLWILGYDDAVVLPQLGVQGPGPVPLAPPDTSPRDSWPLPAPRAARQHHYSARGKVDVSDVPPEALTALLPEVRLPREPCPTVTTERIRVPPNFNASVLLPLAPGGDLVLGGRVYTSTNPNGVQTAAVVRIHDGQASPLEGFTFAGTSTNAAALKPPRGFAEDGRAHLLWVGGPFPQTRPELRVLTSTGGVGARVSLEGQLATHLFTPESMTARGPLTAAYVTHDLLTHHVLLRRGEGPWTEVLDSPVSGACRRFATTSFVLEFLDDHTLLVGRLGDFVREVDLVTGRSQVVITDQHQGYCLNSYARTDTGSEYLFATTNGDASGGRVAVSYWRSTRAQPWTRFEYTDEAGAEGSGSVGLSDVVLVHRGRGTLDVLQHDQRRPDLPPRLCATQYVGVALRHFVREGDVVYGAGSDDAALLVLRIHR